MDRRDIVSSLKPVDTTSLFEGLDYPASLCRLLYEPQTFQLPAGFGSGRAAFLDALERAGQLAEPRLAMCCLCFSRRNGPAQRHL